MSRVVALALAIALGARAASAAMLGARALRRGGGARLYELPEGTRVRLRGLKADVALNGQEGEIEKFDAPSGRYVVQLPGRDQQPRMLRRVNLDVLDLVEKRAEAVAAFTQDPPIVSQEMGAREAALTSRTELPPWGDAPGGGSLLRPGTAVVLQALTHARDLNGQKGRVKRFDFATGRYIVELRGQPPRKIKPENLRSEAIASAQRPQAGDAGQGAPVSICASIREGPDAAGPSELPAGSRAKLVGLSSDAAVRGGWNGKVVVVHCFEATSGRYVVAMPDGMPLRILPSHLHSVNAVAPATDQPSDAVRLAAGAPAMIRAVALGGDRGQGDSAAKVRTVATETALTAPQKSSAMTNVVATNQSRRGDTASINRTAAPATQIAGAVAKTPAILTICNAYPQHEPLHLFMSPTRKGGRPRLLVRDLQFQACADLSGPSLGGRVLRFVVGHLEVARHALRIADFGPRRGLELTLHRADPNLLKGSVRHDRVKLGSKKAYYLNVVQAYAGQSEDLRLEVRRGKFDTEIPINRVFRLGIKQRMDFTLSDGDRRMQLAFEPRLGRGYCLIVTGAAAGFRGEPREPGLIAHELGSWTVAEELPPPPSAPGATSEEPPEPAPAPAKRAQVEGVRRASAGLWSLVTRLGAWL